MSTNNLREKRLTQITVTSFVLLSISVSLISTFHSFDFFKMSNEVWMAWFLSVTFEIGQIAALAAIVVNTRLDMRIVWSLMIFLTSYQIMNNIYYSYAHMSDDYGIWSEMFGVLNLSDIAQKRLIAIISGAFLPLLALGFTKSLVDYLKGVKDKEEVVISSDNKQDIVLIDDIIPDIILPDDTLIDDIIPDIILPDDTLIDDTLIDDTIINNVVNYPIKNSNLGKLPRNVYSDKNTKNFDDMLNDVSLINRIPNYNLGDLNQIPKDKLIDVIKKTPRLLSLVYKHYIEENKHLKGRKVN